MLKAEVNGEPKPEHRWSGWPGAWCLDCGMGDPTEQAIADGEITFEDDPSEPSGIRAICPIDVAERIAAASVCPEPGSNRHNPYGQKLDHD